MDLLFIVVIRNDRTRLPFILKKFWFYNSATINTRCGSEIDYVYA